MRRRSHVTSTIEQYARQHRTALNGPEQALWSEIRGCRPSSSFTLCPRSPTRMSSICCRRFACGARVSR
jgi:hypothetical protein